MDFDNVFHNMCGKMFGIDTDTNKIFTLDYNIKNFKIAMDMYTRSRRLKYTKNSIDITNLITTEKDFGEDNKYVQFYSTVNRDNLNTIINFFKSLNAKHDLKLIIDNRFMEFKKNRTVNKEGHYLIDNKVKFKYLNNGTLKIIFEDSELFEIVKNILNTKEELIK